MACSPALQTGNEVIVKIAHMQISGHLSSMRALISMISKDRAAVNGDGGQSLGGNPDGGKRLQVGNRKAWEGADRTGVSLAFKQ